MKSKPFRSVRSVRELGFFTLDMGLALLVAAIVSIIAFVASQRAADASLASLQGDSLMSLRAAAHRLVMGNYAAYQANQPIVVNGIALTAAESLTPTVSNLVSMHLGVDSATNAGMYKALTNAGYDFKISRTAACTSAPASADCHVSGLVCLNKPVQTFKEANGGTGVNAEVDSDGIGFMLAHMGGDSGASLIGAEAFITGADGTWSDANPYGKVPGIVCARFGWNANGSDFLRIQDTRDPQFMGGATLAGPIAGNPEGYTLQVNGKTGLKGDTTIGDTTNKTGDLTVGGSVNIQGLGSPGGACTIEGSMLWATVGGSSQLLRCESGTWVVSGSATLANMGDPCPIEGKIGQTSGGSNLVCRDGRYREMADLVGRAGMFYTRMYAQGETVVYPVCSSSTVPRIVPMGVVAACVLGAGACTNNTGAFAGYISNTGIVSIVGADGSKAGTDAMLTVASICSTW